jgi:hypothetical protein
VDLEERSSDEVHYPYPSLKSALGYAVDGEEFAGEIVKCGHEYLDYVAETDIHESEKPLPNIKQNIGRLEEIVD